MQRMNAIRVEKLEKVYDNGTHALRGVSMEVKSGDFFALLGANGAGKTTIIGILTGLVNKTGGHASIFDIDIDKHPDKAKEMVGMVPQEFNFSIWEKVSDIVVQQAGYFGMPRGRALESAEEILKALSLWDKRDQQSMSLSGGMKRRLMIARALVHHPKLLILDEPTAGVDIELRHGMWEYLRKLNNLGTTILLTTHYLEEVEQLCRNVAIIKNGKIIKNDSVKNMLNSLEKQTFVITVNRVDGKNKYGPYDITVVDESTMEVDFGMNENLGDFVGVLSESGITVKDIRPKNNRLEQLYLNILKS